MTSKMQNVFIIGATSAIAEATARLWAADGANLYLVARNPEKLSLLSVDLETRGARVATARLDVSDFSRHAAVVVEGMKALQRVDAVLIAHGDLPDQQLCERDVNETLAAMQINAVAVVSLLTLIANFMQSQGSGVIAVLGSVAGDRGRKSNYVYGSCKALVSTFMEGLAGRMHHAGVHVITIKPGFVDTPMTSHLKKGILWAQPAAIAKIIYDRLASADSGSYYAPRFWWLIMAAVRALPARILYRLNI
jgi:decaprenylphospho-beta-D-erythro-pentofuranosid-2-ulose 2-reductase